MPAVPLGVGSYSRDTAFLPDVVLKNFYVEADASGASLDEVLRLQRPGLALYRTVDTGTQVRALFQQDGVLAGLPVAIIGTSLVKFTAGVTSVLGTVANDGKSAQIAGSGTRIGIVSGGTFYIHDGTVLTTVPLPDSLTPVSVTGINGYFVIGVLDGRFYWVVPGTATIVDALDFATAEQKPDSIVGVLELRGEVYFFGTETVELWAPTGDADLIIAPSPSRTFNKGCLHRDTIHAFDNSAVWLGADGIVYRIENTPQRISTPGIEERIRSRSGDCSAFTFSYDGHSFYALYIPAHGTFVYDAQTKAWAEFESTGSSRWRPQNACQLEGGTLLLGDSASGKVFTLDPSISTDDGVVFDRVVSGSVPFNGGIVRNDRFEIHVGASANCSIQLRWKDDGDWSAYRTLAVKAPNCLAFCTRLGAARQPSRTFEVLCTDNARIRISGASVNEGRAT